MSSISTSPPSETPLAELREFAIALLVHRKLFRFDAEVVADRMLDASVCGHPEGGLELLPDYLVAIDQGDVDPRAQVLTLQDLPACAVLDGSGGMGQIAATKAMQLAVSKCRSAGSAVVVVKNSRPLGATQVYANIAGRDGCIGMCVTNALPHTIGATAQSAWAAPAAHGNVQVIDAAQSPLLAAVLAGALVGGKPAAEKTGDAYSARAEHFCLAIDITHLGEASRFHREVTAAVASVSQMAESPSGALQSGTHEVISPAAAARLAEIARRAGIAVPW